MHSVKTPTVIITIVILLAGAIILHADHLDGTRLKVKVVPEKGAVEKGAKAFDDELVFQNGQCTSTTLARKGFKQTHSHIEHEPTEAEFEIEMTSTSGDVVVWNGELRGTNALGGLQWIQKNGTNLMYEFTGTKQ